MNTFLKKYIDENFQNPGKALDLGAWDFSDVNYLNNSGWKCVGVDKNMGIDLENAYISNDVPFDLVFSNYVLHKINNKNQLVKTAYDNLKNGGKFFIHTFHKSDKNSKNGMDENEIISMLISNGFKNPVVKIFDFYDSEVGHNHWHKILEISATK
ncbi:methyltransferase domain-containing protein [Candidatus Nomurabacteria bacterium]|nr:methyltransferase domain-containing protein [Candidatus Nomurabacteria bacterium]